MWETIEYTAERLQEMVDMTIEYYGKDNDISDTDFLKHEYFDNVSGEAFIKLAYDNENKVLAGQYIVIPARIKVGDEVCKVILSLNTLTREQYRGQKIFVSLAEEVYRECAENGYKFCYGAPNQNSHPGFLKRLQFRDAGIMPLFIKIIHPSYLVKERFSSTVLEKMALPFNLLFKPGRQKGAADIFEVTLKNANLFDDFWRKNMNKYNVIGVRDASYMRWRYIEMPRRDYKIYAVQEGGRVKGYIIGRITEVAGMSCGMIVDFFVEPEQVEVGINLVRKLENFFYQNNVGLMGCLMQKHFEEAHILKKTGFFVCPKLMEPQPFPIIFRKFNDMKHSELMENFDNWFFTMGDYDVI